MLRPSSGCSRVLSRYALPNLCVTGQGVSVLSISRDSFANTTDPCSPSMWSGCPSSDSAPTNRRMYHTSSNSKSDTGAFDAVADKRSEVCNSGSMKSDTAARDRETIAGRSQALQHVLASIAKAVGETYRGSAAGETRSGAGAGAYHRAERAVETAFALATEM